MARPSCKEYGRWDACLNCKHKDCIVGGHHALTGLYPKGFKPHVKPHKATTRRLVNEQTAAQEAQRLEKIAARASEVRVEDLRFVEDIFGIGG